MESVSPRESLGRLIATGSAWTLAGTIVSTLGGLVANLLLARLLVPADVGTFFLAAALVTVAAVVARMGSDRVGVRLVAELRAAGRASEVPGNVRAVVRFAATTSIVVALVVLLGAPALGRLLDTPELGAHPVAIAVWAGCEALRLVLSEVHRGFADALRATVHGHALRAVLVVAALVGLTVAGADVGLETVLNVAAGASVLTLAASAWSVSRRAGLWGGRSGGVLKRALVVSGLPFLVSALSTLGLSQGDLWIVAGSRSTGDVALYGAALRVATLLAVPIVVLNAVLAPVISHFHRQGRVMELEQVIRTSVSVATIPTMMCAGALGLFGSGVLRLLFGDFYADGAPILLYLVVGQLCNVGFGPCGTVLLLTGHGRVATGVTLAASVLTLVAEAAAASAFGLAGIALCSGFGVVVQNGAMAIAAHRYTGIWTAAELRPAAMLAGFRILRGEDFNASGPVAPDP